LQFSLWRKTLQMGDNMRKGFFYRYFADASQVIYP